jgi:hypothetical protein
MIGHELTVYTELTIELLAIVGPCIYINHVLLKPKRETGTIWKRIFHLTGSEMMKLQKKRSIKRLNFPLDWKWILNQFHTLMIAKSSSFISNHLRKRMDCYGEKQNLTQKSEQIVEVELLKHIFYPTVLALLNHFSAVLFKHQKNKIIITPKP